MRTPAGPDDGFSLIELMISMALMSVVTALFATGIEQVYQAQKFTDALSETSGQINNAYVRLDADIRYATAISDPGAAGGSQYVEYLRNDTGADVCTQLRFSPAGQLQQRTNSAAKGLTGWSTLASQLVGPVSFTRTLASDTTYAYQQLAVVLTAQPTGTGPTESATYTFTALNTSATTPSSLGTNALCAALDRS
jgi:prepilin-type N-terminal cleavage/methylation domain-containing protein